MSALYKIIIPIITIDDFESVLDWLNATEVWYAFSLTFHTEPTKILDPISLVIDLNDLSIAIQLKLMWR